MVAQGIKSTGQIITWDRGKSQKILIVGKRIMVFFLSAETFFKNSLVSFHIKILMPKCKIFCKTQCFSNWFLEREKVSETRNMKSFPIRGKTCMLLCWKMFPEWCSSPDWVFSRPSNNNYISYASMMSYIFFIMPMVHCFYQEKELYIIYNIISSSGVILKTFNFLAIIFHSCFKCQFF